MEELEEQDEELIKKSYAVVCSKITLKLVEKHINLTRVT